MRRMGQTCKYHGKRNPHKNNSDGVQKNMDYASQIYSCVQEDRQKMNIYEKLFTYNVQKELKLFLLLELRTMTNPGELWDGKRLVWVQGRLLGTC